MLKVEGLCKNYPTFALKDVGFELRPGYIMGFIGENGSGKTTTIKSIMNIVHPDGGTVTVFGKNMATDEAAIKQDIGLLLCDADWYPLVRVGKFINATAMFYDNWDAAACDRLLKKFGIDRNKRLKELSAGMKVKLHLTIALSHNAKLFILDEPTSGLDPIARDDLLDILQELISDGEKSVVFSTHITSDLDKCADYILFIQGGKIIENKTKDDLIQSYFVVKGDDNKLTEEMKNKLIGLKINSLGFSGLVAKDDKNLFCDFETASPNIEDIMVYYGRENGHDC